MLKRLPIPKKYLLIGGTLLLTFLSYQAAFKRTVEAWELHNELNGQSAINEPLRYPSGYIQRKNRNLDSLLAHYQADSVTFKSNSITTIALIAARENVQLSEVLLQSKAQDTQHSFIQKIILQGDYFSIIKVLNEIQKTKDVGIVRSVSVRIPQRQYKPQISNKLFADVYLEIIKE